MSERPATRSRATAMDWISRALLAVWAVGLALVLGAYLMPRAQALRPGEDWVNAVPLDSLRLGEARLVRHEGRPFHVLRLDAEHVVAVSAICPHLRCVVRWDARARTFVCPCHAERWSPTGGALPGTAADALASYHVSVRAGDVWVHL